MPVGKQVRVAGTVRKITRKENDITGEKKFFMNVTGRGWQMWGTLPAYMVDDVSEGTPLVFVADVSASSANFGNFRRPRKISVLDPAD